MDSKNSEKWSQIFLDWEQSGLSKAEFCRQRKLSQSTFQIWYRKLGKSSPTIRTSKDETQEFVELHIPRDLNASLPPQVRLLKIRTSYGATVEIPL